MNWDINWTTILAAVVAGFFGWVSSSKNDGTAREDVYAKHTKDLWDRLDTLSNNLEAVTQERDELRDKVNDLTDKINFQNRKLDAQEKMIKQLTFSVNSLKTTYEEDKHANI